MGKIIAKTLLCLLAVALLSFTGMFAFIFVSFAGAGTFYMILVTLFFVAAIIFSLMQILNLPKPKIRYISAAAVVAAMLVSAAVFEINKAYHNSFEEVGERSLNLESYSPFGEGTLAVPLNEPSALSLNDNLPRLDGATALYPVYSAFVKAVYPEDSLNESPPDFTGGVISPEKTDGGVITCSGTDGAYYRLVSGDADIIFAAGPSQGELQMAKDAGVELTLTPIGREAFVFFVNSQNPVNGLSISDIQNIYSGKITNWRELGGSDSKIRAFQRPADSGSQTALIGFMGGIPLMTPPKEEVATGMMGIIDRVSSYRNYDNAIGYSFLFFTSEMVNNDKIKLLELEGVPPTRENVTNQTYPYASEFYAVTAGAESPNTKALIQWILSPQGQYLIEKTGYTPLKP